MNQRFGQARTTARRASRRGRSPALAGLVIAGAVLAAAGCSSSSSGSQASTTGSNNQGTTTGSSLSQLAAADLSVSQLVAGAKKEGSLSLYYADTGTPAGLKARFGSMVFHLDFGGQEAAAAAETALSRAGYRPQRDGGGIQVRSATGSGELTGVLDRKSVV